MKALIHIFGVFFDTNTTQYTYIWRTEKLYLFKFDINKILYRLQIKAENLNIALNNDKINKKSKLRIYYLFTNDFSQNTFI